MKKGLIVVLSITILMAGCFKKDDYDQETIHQAEAAVESYLKNNYKDIETVEIKEVYKSPMGGMTADGTVNNKFEFNIGVEESDFTIGSIGEGEGFPELKEECKEKSCDF